jgi:protein O-GlcNAc transferase
MDNHPLTIEYDVDESLRAGLKLHQSGRLDEALKIYAAIVDVLPGQPDALHLMGLVYQASGNYEEAVCLIEKAIDADPTQPLFYKNLGNVFEAAGNLENALHCFKKALRISPRYAEAHCGLATILHRQGKIEAATDAYKTSLECDPGLESARLNLAHAFHQTGRTDDALKAYREILCENPTHIAASYHSGVICIEKHADAEAVEHLTRAIRAHPRHAEAHFHLGVAYGRLGETGEAIECYRRALDIKPDLAEAYNNLGLIYQANASFDTATQFYAEGIRQAPELPALYNNLGTALHKLGRITEAATAYKKAIDILPRYTEALNNLGNMHQILGNWSAAIEFYRKALDADPQRAEPYYHMGLAYQNQNRFDAAISCHRKALELNPAYDLARCQLYYLLRQVCDWQATSGLEAEIDGATRSSLQTGRKPAEDPFLNLIRHADPELNYQLASAYSSEITDRLAHMPVIDTTGRDAAYSNETSGRITIGYLSNNFRNHPTAQLIRRIFKLHDRKRFNIYCYSFGENDRSTYREEIRRDCDRFVDIRESGHWEAARRICLDGVDILVDLCGFSQGNRLEIAALRPAPVQVRWLGMPGTTGADFFDYLITDRVVTPPVEARCYSEKLVFMPDCYQVNDTRHEITEVLWSKKELNLPSRGVAYCCFCAHYKIDPLVFDSWMTILKKVPGSALWLLGGGEILENNLRREAQSRGVEPKRIVFAPKLQKAQHLARLKAADLALDTIRVNGAITTSDAIYAGLPVITTRGNHFASRMAAGILNAVSMNALVAENLHEYETLAVELGRNPIALTRLKKRLQKNILRVPLFDTPRFVRHIEAAYSEMWQRWQSGKSKNDIRVLAARNGKVY